MIGILYYIVTFYTFVALEIVNSNNALFMVSIKDIGNICNPL
jgi:hypothetical protein